MTADISIDPEKPEDIPAIEVLLTHAMGPGRFAKPSYRLREGRPCDGRLSLVARDGDGTLVGSLRFWAVRGDTGVDRTGLLLGPLAVEPEFRGHGWGVALIYEGLARAAEVGYSYVLLVGDEKYYSRTGFSAAAAGGLKMPNPFDPSRLLARELLTGGLDGVAGTLVGAPNLP